MTETLFEQSPPTESEPIYADYWGFDEKLKWFFPDGKQYIEFQLMDEGKRARFQKLTNRDISIKRSTGDASIKADPAEERKALLEQSVVDWHVFRGNQPVPFSIGSGGSTFNQWLDHANPKLIDDLEFEIRKNNPWLQADMTLEDIDKEIDRLKELRKQTEERELEKVRS